MAAGQPVTADLTGQDLGGQTPTAGAYKYATSAQLTGTLTLNAQGNPNAQFVIEIGSTQTTASNSSVVLTNGASPCNVFWQVGSSATLGTTTAFEGNILANTSITANTGATVQGRLLARTAAVTLDTNVIGAPACGTSTTPPTGGTSGTGGNTPPPSRSTIPTRKGSATLKRAKTSSGSSSSSSSSSPMVCNEGFTATVRGREIKRVMFTLGGKRLANLTRSPFRVHVPPPFAGTGHLKARVTFKDATRAKMLNLNYRACAAAVVQPLPALDVHRMTLSGPTVRRSLGSRRGTFGMAAALLLSVACCITSVPVANASTVPVGQALVALTHTHVARAAPSMSARPVMTVAARRPLTGARTVLPALGSTTSNRGRDWVRVRLPGRPNSSTGWITRSGTIASWTAWRLSVNLSARRVTVWQRGRVVRRFPAIVGAPSTPTPHGSFFIEESLSLSAQASGAPFALATSARSDVLQEFDGGPGQIALHGMGNLAGALGTAASHGCIRLDTPDITWLVMHIVAGVPLSIVR